MHDWRKWDRADLISGEIGCADPAYDVFDADVDIHEECLRRQRLFDAFPYTMDDYGMSWRDFF